jgi:aminoglycoside 6'-N-acetyltransferase I
VDYLYFMIKHRSILGGKEMDVVYKKISEDMLDEIIELFVETFNSQPWNDNWTVQTSSKRLCPIIFTEGFFGLSAYQDNKICGFTMGFFEQYCDEKEFIIKEFAIRNMGRGRGLGSQLLMEFEKRLREMGVKKIILLTLKGNLTEHFYEKNGFKTNTKMAFMNKTI